MSSEALSIVDGLVSKVSALSSAPAAALPSGGDYAWKPAIPQGHTGYSWLTQTNLPGYTHPVDPKAPVKKVEAKAPEAAAPAKKETAKKDSAPSVGTGPVFSRLDIRVGVVTTAKPHPEADALYLEEIDIGEEKPRQVISGLRAHIALDKFIGSRVLLLANLNPAKLRGTMSYGMVLCACNADKSKVELVTPPAGAKIGERVYLEGEPELLTFEADKSVNLKKADNPWGVVQPDLKTDASFVATFQGKALITAAGKCTAQTLGGASIS